MNEKSKALLSPLVECKSKTEDEDAKWEMIIEARPSTEDVDSYNEITDGKAMMKALEFFMKENPVMMFNHQKENTIGRVLEYWDDDGPVIKGGIAKTEKGKEVAELIRVGVISKMSFMFGNASYEKEDADDDNSPDRLTAFKLYEIGPISIPANMGAVIEAAKEAGVKLKALNQKTISKEQGDTSKGIEAPAIIDQDKESNKMADKDAKLKADALKLGDVKTEVEDLASRQGDMEILQTTHAKTMKAVLEKVEQLKKGQITDSEWTEFSENIGKEIGGLQSQIRRMKAASSIQGSKETVMSWKSLDPAKTPVVFDDAGHALPEIHQRAHHLFYAPVNYETGGEAGRTIKQIREMHDAILYSNAYFRSRAQGNFNITKLKSWNVLQGLIDTFDPEFAKAMASTTTGFGDEWVPTESSTDFYDAYRLSSNVESYIPHWSMPSNPATYPILTTRPRMYRAGEVSVNNPVELPKSDFGTSKTTFTTETYTVCVPVSQELIEDSIIPMVPALNKVIATSMAEYFESMMLNGDSSATHMDTAADWATDSAYPESYEKGFRKLAIDSSTSFDSQDTTTGVGDGTTAFAAQDMRYLRQKMPSPLGHRASDLIYIVSLYVWMKMLSFEQYSKIGDYGANASWLTGDIPTFDGSPLIISSQFPITMDSAGKLIGPGTLKGALCVNKESFKVGEKRNVTLEFDKEHRTQQWSFIASMRKSFQPMTSSSAAGVGYATNIA